MFISVPWLVVCFVFFFFLGGCLLRPYRSRKKSGRVHAYQEQKKLRPRNVGRRERSILDF